MLLRILISFLIFTLVCLPAIAVSAPVVAILLLTPWKGYSTIFGNKDHGRGVDRGMITYGQQFTWLVLRNPVNNLMGIDLAIPGVPYVLTGDQAIGDKLKGGFYSVKMGPYWEYYFVKPYGAGRCFRARIGWKIHMNAGECAFVFDVNPMKPYLGI